MFSARAEKNLQSLFRYIAKSSYPSRAAGYITSIREHCESLGLSPHRGVNRDDLYPGLRTVGFDRTATIAFEVKADVVVIAAIYYRGVNVQSKP